MLLAERFCSARAEPLRMHCTERGSAAQPGWVLMPQEMAPAMLQCGPRAMRRAPAHTHAATWGREPANETHLAMRVRRVRNGPGAFRFEEDKRRFDGSDPPPGRMQVAPTKASRCGL